MKDPFRESIIIDIKKFLDDNRKVIISCGSVNDIILSYREEKEHINNCYGGYDKTNYVFITTACIFPKEIRLEDYDECDFEECNDVIFIEVT